MLWVLNLRFKVWISDEWLGSRVREARGLIAILHLNRFWIFDSEDSGVSGHSRDYGDPVGAF